jgi:hypothetical protein
VLRFDKDNLPRVSVFWNLSMYDDKAVLIENDLKRYTIGSTTDGWKRSPSSTKIPVKRTIPARRLRLAIFDAHGSTTRRRP